MYALHFLLLTLHSLVALDPAQLKPGALTAHIGRVALVEDTLWVSYPSAPLVSIPDRLGALADKLSERLKSIETHIPSHTVVLRDRLEQLRDLVVAETENYHDVHLRTRVKRGLVDGIGHLSRALFGTALDSDVEDLRDRYNDLAKAAAVNDKAVKLNSRNIDRLNDNLNKVIDHAKRMEIAVNKAVATLSYKTYLLDILLTLSSLENLVRNIIRLNERLLTNMVDASHSRVTPSLMPVEDLLHALRLGDRQYKLKPIYSETDIAHYYPLLSSIVTDDAIVIIVPFQSDHKFEAHSVVPFPTLINNTVITLSLNDMIVAINDQRTLFATLSHDEFHTCKAERFGLYFCPASLFAFLPVDPTGICEISLTQQDVSRCLSLCPYHQLASKPFFHKSFLDHHYFLFTAPTYVSVKCRTNFTVTQVEGHFATLKMCSLRSKAVNTLPEKLQKGFIAKTPTLLYRLNMLDDLNATSIQYMTNSISEFKFANFSDLESAVHDSLPVYVRPYVHYPSVLIPFVITIVVVLILSCLVKKALVLYNTLNARVAQRTATTPPTPDTSSSRTDVSR